ncbi:MAG TPA: DUF2993 domain-containing protein [Oscillatoriaceae cyanobacterium M33_DOE_052]|uniref:DUF2993 domain-containing protein n=1 Tax=Planktothricoides sp. SpSt-374 TaxID=2282167 RepID=A0A7C3VF80_9CYAN|nr:DUF2993 domain-containing protein [Oscillatoriaceae cyanobacterium M33_DOE_052]
MSSSAELRKSPAPELVAAPDAGLVGRALSKALQVWLRSLLDDVTDLHIRIGGRNRQILTGNIPQIQVSAENACYRGLHLSSIHLSGGKVGINIKQILKGEPFRLLAPVPVAADFCIVQEDLNRSLSAPMLADAIRDALLSQLPLPPQPPDPTLQITLATGKIALSGIWLNAPDAGPLVPAVLHTGLTLADGHKLHFVKPYFQSSSPNLPVLDDFYIDLGSDITLDELTITPGQLVGRGGFVVMS